jgi:HSP20 family protein
MTIYIHPYRRLSGLRDAMERLFEETMVENTPAERELTLAVDVTTDDDGFTLYALAPGLEADDLNIEILNNTVSVRGEFKSTAGENVTYLNSELPQGRFSRTITLPVAVDAAKVEANIKNGVLMLRLPKAEAHRPKPIKVKTA